MNYINMKSFTAQLGSKETNQSGVELFGLVEQTQKIVSEAGGPATLDLQGLPTGMYFVRITTAKGTSTHKLLKR